MAKNQTTENQKEFKGENLSENNKKEVEDMPRCNSTKRRSSSSTRRSSTKRRSSTDSKKKKSQGKRRRSIWDRF